MTPALVVAGLETVLDRVLRLDPDIGPRLAALNGAIIAIESTDLGLNCYLLPGPHGVQLLDRYDGEPTVRIRGSLAALVRQSSGRQQGGEVAVEGDAAVGREFQAILMDLHIDWEEQLSQVIGDVAAYRLGRLWRGFRDWGQQTSGVLLRDSGEYLQQELRVLPPHHAVEQFLTAVDVLREDTDRLALRIERLRRQLTVDESA